MYVQPRDMVDQPGALQECAELFDVAAALLYLTIIAGDTSGFEPVDVAKATKAVETMTRYCAEASDIVDGYLSRRGYAVPLNAEQFPILRTYARWIVRYQLNPQREPTSETTGRIERDFRQAHKALEMIATGQLTLGAADPLAKPAVPAASGGPTFVAEPTQFRRDQIDY